jgi:cytochrome P450
MLAITVFPDVLKAAQEELDRVVGKDRLPTFDDEERLPYIRAMVKETLRWRPVAVLGGTVHPLLPSASLISCSAPWKYRR